MSDVYQTKTFLTASVTSGTESKVSQDLIFLFLDIFLEQIHQHLSFIILHAAWNSTVSFVHSIVGV